MPKLSIIVPVYNTAQYLKLCIESILAQSFADYELLLVDNHSTDGGSDILQSYTSQDSRIRCLVTDTHGKATATRQFGLNAAIGEFITFVDSDDSIKPGMYEHMFREQEKNNADIVVCNYDLVYPDKTTPSYSAMKDEVIDITGIGYPYYFKKYFCMQRPNNYLWSRIMRREIIERHRIGFEPVDISEDTIFTMFCTAFAGCVVHISTSYYNYYQREDSTMRQTIRSKNIADSYAYAFDCVDRFVKFHGIENVFHYIMPLYAATRVRSILFYIKLAGSDESLINTLNNSRMPGYLQRAISEGLIEDPELADIVNRTLEVLRSPA